MDARAGQYKPDTVRVVMDIKSFKTYEIFSLDEPFRIVIDVWGEGEAAPRPPQQQAAVKLPSGKIPPGSIARSLALGVSRIVIDAGHGGKDPGAKGYCSKAREKDITLSIAKRLKKKLETRLGCEVIMTRRRDQFLTLEERTAFANTKDADLFISIHVNAHRNKRAYGVETYFLNLATDEDAIRVAAMENATSTKNISDLQTILMDLMQNAKINESSRLASHVQTQMSGASPEEVQQHKGQGCQTGAILRPAGGANAGHSGGDLLYQQPPGVQTSDGPDLSGSLKRRHCSRHRKLYQDDQSDRFSENASPIGPRRLMDGGGTEGIPEASALSWKVCFP